PPAAGAIASPAAAPAPGSVKRGAVYRYDRDGVIHYTNVRPTAPGTKAELVFTYAIENCIACEIRSSVDWHSVALKLDEYRSEIARAAMAHGVDEALVRAVIHAESAYRANARSNKGAQGLMQLIPATAARFGVTDPYDPAQNIAGGVQYLAWLLNRFNGDVRLATAGYNAGEGAVDRHGGVPPYAETQVYVERVAILHGRYRAALDAAAGVLPATASAAANGGNPGNARLIGTVQ
ncbi:lytic transglycosylase domain-containing protein, partial [Pseudofulvimonas gallinarii]